LAESQEWHIYFTGILPFTGPGGKSVRLSFINRFGKIDPIVARGALYSFGSVQ
jgi:hypothetical protein